MFAALCMKVMNMQIHNSGIAYKIKGRKKQTHQKRQKICNTPQQNSEIAQLKRTLIGND